jgi:V/A-type H+/Na+-transporting ATPase subunit C
LSRINKPQRIFGTVRAFAEKGKMLSKTELELFADSRDLDELVTKLKNTAYTDVMAKLQKPFNAEKIENLLREDLVDFHASMAKIVTRQDLLNAYYTKYIIWNLKVILKGKAMEKTYEEILPHVNMRAEELIGRRDIVVKALVAKDLDEATATLQSSEFGGDVSRAAQTYKEKGDIQIFDVYLDHSYYQALATAYTVIGKPADVHPIIGLDVDSYNTLSTLRAKYWGLSEMHIKSLRIKPTFRVQEDILDKMSNAENVKEAISVFTSTVYKSIVPNDANEIEMISKLEAGFEHLIYRRAVTAYSKMFSYSTMIASVKLKTFEVRNLGAIAFGVEQKVGSKTIIPRLLTSEEK